VAAASGTTRTRPTSALVAGAASLVVHAGLAVLILKTPLPAAQPQESWTTEVNFAGAGWNEYAESPKLATLPQATPPDAAPQPTESRDQPRDQSQPQPEPQSQPQPRERFVRPGIDESTSPDSPAWLGAAQATPHEAPLSQVDQAAQSMDPGLPGTPGTDAPDASESPTASQQPGSPPPAEAAGAPAGGSATPTPQAASKPPVEPAPLAATPPAPVAPQPAPIAPRQPTPQPEQQQPVQPAAQPAAGPIQTDRANPAPGDEFATPVTPAKPEPITPEPPTIEPPEPIIEPQPTPVEPTDVAKTEPTPIEPAPPEPAPVQPAPEAVQPEAVPVESVPASAPTPAASAEASPSTAAPGPATNVLGAPSNASSPASGEGGNLRMPGPRSDAESVAASRTVSMTFKPGQPLAGKGLRVRPAPLRLAHMTRMTASPRNPIILIKFNRRGIVTDVEFENNQGTGFPDVDAPLRDSIFRWTASGKVLQDLPTYDPDARVTLKLEYIFRE
jgi:hypothetical protein